MKNYIEIIDDAKKAYEKCFNDIHEMTKLENEDIIVNKEFLSSEIEEMKSELKGRINSLSVLKEKLTIDAKNSFEKTFGKENIKEVKKRVTVEEEYKELNDEKTRLMNWGKELKSNN